MQKPIITIILLIVCLTVATKIKSFIKNNPPSALPVEIIEETETVVCTMDAMMCPDGTYVGRTGLKCEFVCPESMASTTAKATFRLNEPVDFYATTFRVLAVIEDSRCPSDVTCIQAGKAKVALNVGSSTAEVEIGETIIVESLSITLDRVDPYPVSTSKIQDNEYQFSFIIKSE